ncbi:MAG: hypothetical protein A3F11_09865 [Gammaproteobacteria bacterium RIFCSPHIGHO2_12_FULL_37_14]|nr:MAG: hypothetical protein A3F11_09865 [Gammaproteobacteria bacterium RIFCSPHIGHO2_12_FULL_37_14]
MTHYPAILTTYYKIFSRFVLLCVSCALIGGASFASPNVEGIQIYQKNLHLSPEHKQKLADDITRYRTADNLWDVLREEFSLPHYENNPQVQEKIEWFMNNQDYLLRSASRAAPYLYYISQQVKKRHLPAELVLLPIIESGYNPFSLSNVGAAGIWQLMPDTASGLGIKRDSWYDGRRDIIASTRAALNHLDYLQSFFEGNWLYALAAYNTGEGNVLSAIKRNIRGGIDTGFWSLPVAQETKDYVPSLLALAVIISHPDEYPIYFPPVRNAPYLAQVDVGTQINLKYAATLAGISDKKMIQLNPGFSRSSTPTSTSKKGPTKLVIPIENIEQFSENLARSPLSHPINWEHYKVKSGDTIASIAKKFATSTTAIRKLNHLSKNNLHPGANLLIPANDQPIANSENIVETASKQRSSLASKTEGVMQKVAMPIQSLSQYRLQPGDTIYMVRTKDSLESIAKRFHINSKLLQAVNNISKKKIKPGKQLIIPTHASSMNASSLPSIKKSLQPGDTLYMVRHGDTIEKIARKFHTSPATIRLANLVDDNSLIEGEKLVVPTHIRG